MSGSTIYSPGNGGGRFANVNTNAIGSKYAQIYGHGATAHIQRVVRQQIYDAAPQQFTDLKILMIKDIRTVDSDEFSYLEKGYGREPILLDAQSQVNSGVTQSILVLNIESVSKDMLVVYENNTMGIVTNVNIGTRVITVNAMSGKTLPTITAITTPGSKWLTNHSPVEADAADGFSQYFRVDTIERWNYVQMIAKAQRFGRVELHKYMKSGNNYIPMQKAELMTQFRVDFSNIYWNGQMGEVTLANGQKAKTAAGINPILQQAGSPYATATISTAGEALEELSFNCMFGQVGDKKFAYAAPRIINAISKQYKKDLTRYAPNDQIANLGLSMIDTGSTKIVLVPMQRFEDSASFPAFFAKRVFLLDQASITPVNMFPEEMGDTLMRGKNGSRENFQDSWVSGTLSVEFNNPLGCAYMDVTGPLFSL